MRGLSTILLVDDHPMMGEGTKQLIERELDMSVIFVTSGQEALRHIEAQQFDLYIYDMNLPDMDGVELARRSHGHAPILMYSGFEFGSYFNALLQAGVVGFISKTASPTQLIRAIHNALEGIVTMPITLLQQLQRKENLDTYSENLCESIDDSKSAPLIISELVISDKERFILEAIAQGKSNKEIAEELYMSQRTVEYQLTGIFNKFGVHSRTEAVLEAKRHGLGRF